MISDDDHRKSDHPDGITTGEDGEYNRKRFMNAKDLVDLRELPDILVHHAIGEKSYMLSDRKSEDDVVKVFIDERNALLKVQKTSTIGSLIVAEWNVDSQKAVAKKLEGKFSQHLGKFSQGKIMLSPEETLFLLENENLELHYGGRPVSVEEAHSLMITSNYANLRYLVYVHLSLLGYTMVLHQGKINTVTPYEKRMNLVKQKVVGSKKRKRKSANISRKKAILESNQSRIQESNTCDDESARLQEGRCEKSCVSATSSSEPSPCIIKPSNEMIVTHVNTKINSHMEETKTNDTVSLEAVKEIHWEVLISGTKETAKVSEDVVASENQNIETCVYAFDEDPRPKNNEEFDTVLNEQITEQIVFSTKKANEFENEKLMSDITADETKKPESVEPFDSEVVTSDECHIVVDTAEKCEVMKIEASDEQRVASETNVKKASESSESDDEKEIEEAKDQPNEEEYENESMTSSSNDSVVRIDTENESLDCMDADVEIVTVTKKEKKPLAVINLFSEEENEENTENDIYAKQNNSSDEDDDIQIIEECSLSVTLSKRPAQASEEKKPKYISPKVDVEFNKAVTWPFPNLLKKTVACLPRPAPHLIPNNVHLTKEAYTLDLKKLSGMVNSQQPTRVWNSYKDLLSRRRGAAVGNSGFRGSFWNIPQDQRPFSPQQGHSSGIHNDWNNGAGSPQFLSPAFMRGNGMNPNSSLISQSPPMFVKSENSSVPSHIGNPQVSSSVFHGIPQENFSQFVSIAATQAAVEAARNVIMSMTGNMNVSVDCLTNPPMPAYNDDNISFPGALRGAPFLGSSMTNNIAIERNFTEGMHHGNRSLGNYQNVSQFSDHIHTSQLRTKDSPRDFYQPCHAASGSLPYNVNQDEFYRPAASGNDVRSFQMRSSTNGCNPFPSNIPKGPRRVSSWREYKSAVTNSDITSNDVDDVKEVPINLMEMLWSKHLSPLTRSEIIKSSCDILKSSQITLPARLTKGNAMNERFMPTSCSLEIAFDVYLPNVVYKKTCPDVPNLRIVVVDAQDPFPKLGDIVFLARKFEDSASLIFAVVDDKDISYFSFVFMDLPELLP